MTLEGLTALLESNAISEKIEGQAITTSIHVSTSSLLTCEPRAMKLFLIMGLLPDHTSIAELDKFWRLTGETVMVEGIVGILEKACLVRLE